MESFLSASKAASSNLSAYKRIRVVLGNETCDLDSAVSALVQAFSEYLDGIKNKETDSAVIPLMNIAEKEYRLKTEVVFFLERHSIPSDLLTFRDQIDLQSLKKDAGRKLEVVLVDHHQLADRDAYLADCVVKVIDHRPRDERWCWPGREVDLRIVGSCATLVARRLLDRHPEALDSQVSSLLRGPILIDTCNFSKESDRATPIDVEIAAALEKAGQLDLDRDKAFDEIVKAKSDVSQLSADDLLIRDLKVIVGVPIVGLPMLAKDFVALPDSLKAVENFARSRNAPIVVLMGLQLSSGKVSRDIAIFSLADHPVAIRNKVIEALTVSAQPSLHLTLINETREPRGQFQLLLFAQGNLRITRKQVLPIVRDAVLSELERH